MIFEYSAQYVVDDGAGGARGPVQGTSEFFTTLTCASAMPYVQDQVTRLRDAADPCMTLTYVDLWVIDLDVFFVERPTNVRRHVASLDVASVKWETKTAIEYRGENGV